MFCGFQNHITQEEGGISDISPFFIDALVKIWQKMGQKTGKITWEYLQTIKSVI